MIRSKFAHVCALMVFAGGVLFAQDTPPKKSSRIEHRSRKAGGEQSAAAGIESGKTSSIPQGGWNKNKAANGTVAGSNSNATKRGARSNRKHVGGIK
jgi:hypothetical protein